MDLTRQEQNFIRLINGTRATLIPAHRVVSVCARVLYVLLPISAFLAYRDHKLTEVYICGYAMVATICFHALLNLQIIILKLTDTSHKDGKT